MNPDGPRALLLNGTVGVGKSTVAEAIAGLLGKRGIANAYLDMDGLRRKWPTPTDDPFNSALAMTNLSSLAANFVRAGVERLVLAGVVESESELAACSSAVGMPLVTCRLRLDGEALAERLGLRHSDEAELRWHLARAPELDQILDAAAVDDYAIDVSTLAVSKVAQEVLSLVGWVN